jgi:hypothetical protein
MPLVRIPESFDHDEWIYELKLDGFRALAFIDGHHSCLVSRNGHTFKHWPYLNVELAHAIRCDTRCSMVSSASMMTIGRTFAGSENSDHLLSGNSGHLPVALPGQKVVGDSVSGEGKDDRGTAASARVTGRFINHNGKTTIASRKVPIAH